MKTELTVLLLVAIVAGMTAPAAANPQNEPTAVAKNIKDIFVEVDGAIPTNNNVEQHVMNMGNQDNWALGIGLGGNADAMSANVGAASSGATAGVFTSNDAMGDAEANSYDNFADVYQNSYAVAAGGDPEGFSDYLIQYNEVYADQYSDIDNWQNMENYVEIDEWQDADAAAPGVQNITDSMFDESGWTKSVSKYFY